MKDSEESCRICRNAIAVDEERIKCALCEAVFHLRCVSEKGFCPRCKGGEFEGAPIDCQVFPVIFSVASRFDSISGRDIHAGKMEIWDDNLRLTGCPFRADLTPAAILLGGAVG